MSQQIMWINAEEIYRGQASDGTIVTIEKDALEVALRKAGRGIWEADWWTETLPATLQHWGLTGQQSIDPLTRMPTMHFGQVKATGADPTGDQSKPDLNSGSLLSRLATGKFITGKLSDKDT
jgi:hypothetical protein